MKTKQGAITAEKSQCNEMTLIKLTKNVLEIKPNEDF
jgi:hypothetical protein